MAYTVQYVHSGSAVETYLAVDCTTGSTSITLNDATGWPSPTGSQVAYGKIKPGQTGESAFTYTSRSGNVLSGVTWSADGTTSTSYTAGSATVIRHGFTANEADEANAAVRNTLGRVTAIGDTLYADSTTTLAKLAKGTSGQFYKQGASVPSWASIANTDVSGLGTAATKDTGYTASKIPVLTATPGTPDGTKFLRDDGTWATAAGALLATVQYSTTGSYSTTSTAFVDIDATNLVLTFTVPSSGNVILVQTAWIDVTTAGVAQIWNVRAGSSDIANTDEAVYVPTAGATSQGFVLGRRIKITGLTPGASTTWKWGWKVSSAGTARMYTGNNAGANTNASLMEVWSA